ncbi:uncharacterized protein TNIN_137861 [Trichonephila inaurata madagascariensis]|uniref:HAUS augmin-like complex subunit 1 n=1 Tax=Trichonephila inaurata madagascariensis TaxID=2747483 RepID=A0A8X6XYG5_9ARAC|nr:uncharacterized protein TNIN_137861 [Trichonephila inaurata madagascariensis]
MCVNMGLSNLCDDQHLQYWLKELFQDEDIPPFDETPAVMELLKQIMSANKAAEKDANVIVKAEKNMKNCYDKKTKDLQLLTDFIQLSAETNDRVEKLASLAEKMKLKEPSLTNFLLGMVEAENREMLKKEKDLVSNHHTLVLGKKIGEVMKINEKLKRDLKRLEGTVKIQENLHSEKVDQIAHCAKKTEEFKAKIIAREKILHGVNYADSFRHSTLVEKAEAIKKKEEEVKERKSKVEAYEGISSSYTSALQDINLKQKELLELEEEIQKLLEN